MNRETLHIQWYPGHMAKARRLVEKNLKLVDVVIELLDARAPLSTQNPMINKITGNKPRLMILNKADLADKSVTSYWIKRLKRTGNVLAVDSQRRHGVERVPGEVLKIALPAMKVPALGKARPVRCMVVGIPNVGKSLFINSLVKQKVARTGNRPGITKGQQWIRIDKRVELLDTPGILWPKFKDPEVGFRLAVIGSIRQEVYPIEDTAIRLISWLIKEYHGVLESHYNISECDEPLKVMEQVAKKRGFVLAGGKIDLSRTAIHVIKEFRDGKIGQISLDLPLCAEIR